MPLHEQRPGKLVGWRWGWGRLSCRDKGLQVIVEYPQRNKTMCRLWWKWECHRFLSETFKSSLTFNHFNEYFSLIISLLEFLVTQKHIHSMLQQRQSFIRFVRKLEAWLGTSYRVRMTESGWAGRGSTLWWSFPTGAGLLRNAV